jgi:hypothetical protein
MAAMTGVKSRAKRIALAIAGGLLSLLSVVAMDPPPSSGFFPPRATVVLLSGLAGDVENETSYRDQLRGWLELAAKAGVNRVIVLCDAPDSVDVPPGLRAAVGGDSSPAGTNATDAIPTLLRKNSRESFLALTNVLTGETNPLVVVAWGHGGRQGSVPVLHVRGPRITAADFKTVAEGAGTNESRWVLLFPGSGAFARQLTAPRREALASECETMFTSDPIGMTLLLKLLRDHSARTFAAIGKDWGRLTADWYQTRSLARTEEPTLWRDGEKPELLAAGFETNSLASPDASPATAGKPAAAGSAQLSAAWQEIKKVEPRRFPNADAVVLRRRTSYTLGSNPAVSSEQDEYIQILTTEGKRFGDFDIAYTPPHEDITFLDCEVLRADGTLVRLDPDAIHDRGDQPPGDYQAGQRKFFSLPGAGPGAVLHVRYRTSWKTFPLPNVSLEIPVSQELPSIDTIVEATVSKDAPFHFALDDLPPVDPVITQGVYGTTYRWHFENLPAKTQELLVAPRFRPQGVQISTFRDWGAFADWYGRISLLTDEASPELEAKAKELAAGAKTDREKVAALHNYVTRLRYVAVPLGVNSFRPHAATNVFQNQFGDCKDKANLLNAMLHALNIEAHLVLVPRFSQADDAVPGLAFNHAISQVKLGGETLWIDTTDDVCRFGMLPPGDPGRKVLVIDGKSSTLTQLPQPAPRDHELSVRGELDLSRPGEAIPLKLAVRASGYPDYEMRETSRGARQHGASLALLGAKFRPASGVFALARQSSSSVSVLDENFAWQGEGQWVGGYTTFNGEGMLRAPFWLPKEWDLALNARQSPLFLNQGYPLLLDEAFEIRLAAGAAVGSLPAVAENAAGPLRWKVAWAKVGDDKLSASLRVELVRGECSAEDTPELQAQLRRLFQALAEGAGLKAGR